MGKKKSKERRCDEKGVLRFMSKLGRPVSLREICRYFKLTKQKELVKGLLEGLEKKGEILKIGHRRYGLTKKMNLVVGRLACHPDGYGFVIPDEGKGDVFIAPRYLKEAMHGDRVVVRLEKKRRGKLREGEIIRILERKNKYIVGRFETDGQVGFLLPEEKKFTTEVVVPLSWAGDAASGQMVIAEIVRYPSPNRGALAKVIKTLGDETLAATQSEIVTYKYSLPKEFSKVALTEAQSKAQEAVQLGERKDLRRFTLFTIDGERARDFDDAVGIKKERNGYRLFVSIADVAHYVRTGSVLDQEAYTRGNSVYFPDRVLPMLPFELSQGICSLNPNEDRLALTVEMKFSFRGDLLNYDIYESVIRSKARLTYRQVQTVLDGDKSAIKSKRIINALYHMKKLAQILLERRNQRGSLDFDLPEPEIRLDLLGHTTDILRAERLFAHRIIEEFMIAANEVVAEHLTEKGWPVIYRVHDKPSGEKMAIFSKFIETLGYTLPKTEDYTPVDFQRLLNEVKNTPHEFLVHRLLLRSLKQARYSAFNIGHFGLASECYAHFTSPIRRYADLIVHRLLKKQLRGAKPKGKWIEKLEEMAQHISERERLAMEAEREIVDRLRVQFMANKIGNEYEGVISGVNSFGFFVELNEVFVEGVVRLSSLHDDYYLLQERTFSLIGKRTKRQFRLGDRVKVKVINVNPARREIELHLIDKIYPQ